MSDTEEQKQLYERAVGVMIINRRASTSFVQRCLKISYAYAAKLMEQAEEDGIVSKPNHVGKREIPPLYSTNSEKDA